MTQTLTATVPRRQVTSADVHELLHGHGVGTLTVLRQAYRVREDDTDEVIQLTSGRDQWVGVRLGERFTIWACQSADAAADKFEQLMADGPGWTEAQPPDVSSELSA